MDLPYQSKMDHRFNNGVNKGKVILVAQNGRCVRVHSKIFLETGFGQSYNRFSPVKLGTNVIQTEYKENILIIIFQKLYKLSYVIPPLPLEDVIDLVFLIDEYLVDNFIIRSEAITMLCQLITVQDFIELYEEFSEVQSWMVTFLEINCHEKISTDDFLLLWKKYGTEMWFQYYTCRYFKHYMNQNKMDDTINKLLYEFLRRDDGYLSGEMRCLKFLLTCNINDFICSNVAHSIGKLEKFLNKEYNSIITYCKIVQSDKVYQILINQKLAEVYRIIELHFEYIPEGEGYKRAKKEFTAYLKY